MSRFPFSFKRSLAAGGAVLLLGGSAVGIASAQSTPTPTPAATAQPGAATTRPGAQAFLDALAKRLNISTATLQQAVDGARSDVGAPAGGPGFGRGFGRGPGGPGGAGGPGLPGGPGRAGGLGGELNAAAQAIGIPADQLRTEVSGKSLTDVAKAHGKNPADVATALKNAAHTRIDAAVTAGRLTADQATTRKQQIDTRIDQQMTQVVPQRAAPTQ